MSKNIATLKSRSRVNQGIQSGTIRIDWECVMTKRKFVCVRVWHVCARVGVCNKFRDANVVEEFESFFV